MKNLYGGTRSPSCTDNNPTPLKLFVINFPSVLAKSQFRVERSNLLHEYQPDVIFGTETWLSLSHTEFFPTGYFLFRKYTMRVLQRPTEL